MEPGLYRTGSAGKRRAEVFKYQKRVLRAAEHEAVASAFDAHDLGLEFHGSRRMGAMGIKIREYKAYDLAQLKGNREISAEALLAVILEHGGDSLAITAKHGEDFLSLPADSAISVRQKTRVHVFIHGSLLGTRLEAQLLPFSKS